MPLFKDVTIRLGRAGVKGKSDDVILCDGFFLTSSLRKYNDMPGGCNYILKAVVLMLHFLELIARGSKNM